MRGYFFQQMDSKSKKLKIPSELSLAASLSGGLTIVYILGRYGNSLLLGLCCNVLLRVQVYILGRYGNSLLLGLCCNVLLRVQVISATYIVLCILAIVYRFECKAGLAGAGTGDDFFIYHLYRIYIQADSCGNPQSSPPAGVMLMEPDTVFIFLITTLVASVLTFAAAIALIVVVAEKKSSAIFAITWTYICICVASIAVDVTFSVFFGLDYAEMAYTMENSFPGMSSNYINDVIRIGSLFFMTIVLKGYLAPVINTILFILLAVYATKYMNKLQIDEHSIHKMGAINAYDQQINRGFVPEEPRRSPRSPTRTAPPLTPLSDYPNSRNFDRSTSWQHSPAPMPFSYMEEPRRARASPGPSEQWRRDPWPPAPPVPAPDYSPPQARRLKSALKPNYM